MKRDEPRANPLASIDRIMQILKTDQDTSATKYTLTRDSTPAQTRYFKRNTQPAYLETEQKDLQEASDLEELTEMMRAHMNSAKMNDSDYRSNTEVEKPQQFYGIQDKYMKYARQNEDLSRTVLNQDVALPSNRTSHNETPRQGIQTNKDLKSSARNREGLLGILENTKHMVASSEDRRFHKDRVFVKSLIGQLETFLQENPSIQCENSFPFETHDEVDYSCMKNNELYDEKGNPPPNTPSFSFKKGQMTAHTGNTLQVPLPKLRLELSDLKKDGSLSFDLSATNRDCPYAEGEQAEEIYVAVNNDIIEVEHTPASTVRPSETPDKDYHLFLKELNNSSAGSKNHYQGSARSSGVAGASMDYKIPIERNITRSDITQQMPKPKLSDLLSQVSVNLQKDPVGYYGAGSAGSAKNSSISQKEERECHSKQSTQGSVVGVDWSKGRICNKVSSKPSLVSDKENIYSGSRPLAPPKPPKKLPFHELSREIVLVHANHDEMASYRSQDSISDIEEWKYSIASFVNMSPEQ